MLKQRIRTSHNRDFDTYTFVTSISSAADLDIQNYTTNYTIRKKQR